jgi:hypothetical protein
MSQQIKTIYFMIFLSLALLQSCGVKTNPIPPEGTFLPDPSAPYFNDELNEELHSNEDTEKEKQDS